MFAATHRGVDLAPGDAAKRPMLAACLAKPITATLFAEAMVEHRLDWSSGIDDLLHVGPSSNAALAGITLRHLLNHTHGLDASALDCAPVTANGFIDAAALCAQLNARRLGEPGKIYSYSIAGPWLAGALIEQLKGRPYSHVLHERGFWRTEAGSMPLPPRDICPATGRELVLSVSQWLQFLELHLRKPSTGPEDARTRALAFLQSSPLALPGWNPAEQGVCLGWKYYGAGWFGHNSNVVGLSSLLRFNPEQDVAIVVEVSDDAAFLALAGLFGMALPEIAHLRPPRLLAPQEIVGLKTDKYVGTYSRARGRLVITATPTGSLSLSTETADSNGVASARALKPAESEIFIPEPRDNPELAFLQFVSADRAGAFEYAWNGKQLWRRE